MKYKFLFLWIVCLLVASSSRGESSGPKLEIAAEPAVMYGLTPAYGPGVGVGLFLGLRLDSQLSVGIEPGVYFTSSLPAYNPIAFPNTTGGGHDLELAALFKEHFGQGAVRFLLEEGGGVSSFSDNTAYDYQDFYGTHHYSKNLTTETDPMAKFGIGFEFKLGEGVSLALPLGLNWIFASDGYFISLTMQPGLDITF